MEANQIKVLYVSQWEEGNIESDAMLNIGTGMILSVSDGGGGEHYEHHIKDVVQIGSAELGVLEADVDLDANDDYRIPDSRQLETFRVAARFEVMNQELGGFINASTQDGAPAYFQTLEAARNDLQEHLEDVIDAVKNGDMESDYDPSEFLIRDIATGETLGTGWNGDKLVFIRSSILYGLDEDQPTTCPKCGSRTDFDDLPSGMQRHVCLGCGKVFFAADDNEGSSAAKENDTDDLKSIAKVIRSKLDKLGFRNKGKPIKHTQVLEVAAAAMECRNRHAATTSVKNAEPMPPNRARLIVEVDYDLNAESIDDMAENLRGMVDSAIQNGMLTGSTTAEVDRYTMDVMTTRSAAAKPVFSVMLLARDEYQTYTWSGIASDPNDAIGRAFQQMNISREESGAPDGLSESEVEVMFVADGEVKYHCAPGDIDEDRFYMHP